MTRSSSGAVGHDLIHTSLGKQVNSRYYRFGYALGSGPSERVIIELDSVRVCHAHNIPGRRAARIKRVPPQPTS